VTDRRAHWNEIYRSRADEQLSWFQQEPRASLELIDSIDPPPQRAIDVGGGQSTLAAGLLDRGLTEVVVLDIAEAAIERARARLGARAEGVRWIVGDVLDAGDLGPFDLWHDRAVYHFLTDAGDRARYVTAAGGAVSPGGHALIATFAPTGPERCSGLPVHRCDAERLGAEFAPAFQLVRAGSTAHTTPWGKPQDFTYALLRRARDD